MARIGRFDRHQQHDRTQGIHRQHILHDGLAGFKVDRKPALAKARVDVQTSPSAALLHRGRNLSRRPSTDRPNRLGWMNRIGEDYRFVGG